MRQNSLNRRTLLRTGAGLLVLAAGGCVWRAWDEGVFSSGTGPAYEPWLDWASAADHGPMRLVHAAILAANAHNTQPWLFHVSESAVDVYVDTQRNIGAMDPLRREMYIGIGCAIENLCIGATANGYRASVSLMPNRADLTHAAHVDLASGVSVSSALYDSIPLRHTNRYAFELNRAIAPSALIQMSVLTSDPEVQLVWFSQPEDKNRISDMIVKATEAIIGDEGQSRSSAAWYRHDWSSLQQHRDGITIDAQGLSPTNTFFGKILPAGTRAQTDAFWLQATRDVQAPTAAAFGVISIHHLSDLSQRIRAGRVWQRLHLWATAERLAMQPLNQVVERADRELATGIAPHFGDAMQSLVVDRSWRPIFMFRAGYPTHSASASPRRSIQDVLI